MKIRDCAAHLFIPVIALLLVSGATYAKEARKTFAAPCAGVYAKALKLAHAKYHDVTEVAPQETLEMETGSRWKNGELTVRVHFTPETPNSCSVQATSLNRGPVLNDPKTFLERLSKESK